MSLKTNQHKRRNILRNQDTWKQYCIFLLLRLFFVSERASSKAAIGSVRENCEFMQMHNIPKRLNHDRVQLKREFNVSFIQSREH